jgi:hypothetical protein
VTFAGFFWVTWFVVLEGKNGGHILLQPKTAHFFLIPQIALKSTTRPVLKLAELEPVVSSCLGKQRLSTLLPSTLQLLSISSATSTVYDPVACIEHPSSTENATRSSPGCFGAALRDGIP